MIRVYAIFSRKIIKRAVEPLILEVGNIDIAMYAYE
jgi:hypothetical protein